MLPKHGELISQITAAFECVARDNGTTLHEADEIDNEWYNADYQSARKNDIDTRWQDVPDKWIANFSSAFYFLNPEGLRYYLPAAMIWHLKHGATSESPISDTISTFLLDETVSNTLLPLLNDAQRRATAKWLQICALELHPPESALERLQKKPWVHYL